LRTVSKRFSTGVSGFVIKELLIIYFFVIISRGFIENPFEKVLNKGFWVCDNFQGGLSRTVSKRFSTGVSGFVIKELLIIYSFVIISRGFIENRFEKVLNRGFWVCHKGIILSRTVSKRFSTRGFCYIF